MPNYVPNTPGYFLPSYMNTYGYTNTVPQQSFSAPAQNQNPQGIIWVDGEPAARSYQLPAGWPANSPIALWDSNDQVIYWKSINQFGAPNKLIKIRYQTEDDQQAIPASGTVSASAGPDMSSYVTKEDLNAMRAEIREMLKAGIQNGGPNNGKNDQNRGGNR